MMTRASEQPQHASSSDPSLDLLVPHPSTWRAVIAGTVVLLICALAVVAPPVLGAVTQPRLGWNPRTFHAFPSDMAVVTKSRLRTSDIQATVHSIEAPGIRVNDIVILPDGPLHEMSTPQGLGPNATVAEHMDAVSRLPGAVRGFPFTVKRGETVIAVTAWQAVNCDAIDPNVRPVVELSSVIGLDATRTLRPGAQPGFFHWENEDGPLLCAEQPAG